MAKLSSPTQFSLAPVLIAVQPFSQTRRRPDAGSEQKRNAKTKELLC
jgi:hypothetical protein